MSNERMVKKTKVTTEKKLQEGPISHSSIPPEYLDIQLLNLQQHLWLQYFYLSV